MTDETAVLRAEAEFRSLVPRAIVPLQTTKNVNVELFEELHRCADRLVRLCRGQETVRKSVLRELLSTFSILRSEAPYVPGRKDFLEKMADQIEMCFHLVIYNEDPSDRKPGVPRVV